MGTNRRKRDNKSYALKDLYEASMKNALTTNPSMRLMQITQRSYLRRLSEWSISRFKWNMPDEIDTRYVEYQLFHHGMLVFYRDDRFDKYMCVRATQYGPQNVYHNPTEFKTTPAPRYESLSLTNKESVPIWGNALRQPEFDVVLMYAERLAQLDISLNIQARNLRHSKVVTASEGQRLTYVNLLRQVDNGDPIVFGTDNLDLSAIQVLDVGGNPMALSALRLEKNQVWNEAMTFLGIQNANQDKKERLVADEVSANNDQVDSARSAAMQTREYACEQINKMFPGANVSVEWNDAGASEIGIEPTRAGINESENDNA